MCGLGVVGRSPAAERLWVNETGAAGEYREGQSPTAGCPYPATVSPRSLRAALSASAAVLSLVGCVAEAERPEPPVLDSEPPLEIYGDVEDDMYGESDDYGEPNLSGAVDWRDAGQHIGTVTEVCGPLVSIVDDESGTFFNVGVDYPDPARFSVVVFDQYFDYSSLSESESYELCVTGELQNYQGVSQIVADDMSQIYIDPEWS